VAITDRARDLINRTRTAVEAQQPSTSAGFQARLHAVRALKALSISAYDLRLAVLALAAGNTTRFRLMALLSTRKQVEAHGEAGKAEYYFTLAGLKPHRPFI
jgi:hypothetical protein